MKNISVICLLLSVVLFVSCGRKRTPITCTGVMCTADFRMLTVYLRDSTGAAYVPDKVETYNANAQLINSQTTAAIPGNSMYTYIDDSNLDDLGVNIAQDVLFKVIKNNVIVKEQSFLVKADCCHVIKVNGVDTLVVQ